MKTETTSEILPGTILIIDDEPAFCMVLNEILSANGYAVKTTRSAQDALAWLEDHAPSLILTDIMMPGMDGYSFLHTLRNQEKLASIPVVAVSAKSLPEDVAAVKQAGGDDLLAKPFTSQELLNCIRRHFHPN